jgi:hypothetical protein
MTSTVSPSTVKIVVGSTSGVGKLSGVSDGAFFLKYASCLPELRLNLFERSGSHVDRRIGETFMKHTVRVAPDLTLKVISSTALMLLKIVAFMDDPQRRGKDLAKDLDDIRGLLAQYDTDSDRIFSDVVLDAALEDYGLAPAFLLGLDLRALCTNEEVAIVRAFLDKKEGAVKDKDILCLADGFSPQI